MTATLPPMTALAAFDAAVAIELPCVSALEYNSHEICKYFAENLRSRISAIAAQAPAPTVAPPVPAAWMNESSLNIFQHDRNRYPCGGGGDMATAGYMRSDYHKVPLYLATAVQPVQPTPAASPAPGALLALCEKWGREDELAAPVEVAAPVAPTEPTDDERNAFELFYRGRNPNSPTWVVLEWLLRSDEGEYDAGIQELWEGWQGRAALTAAQPTPLTDAQIMGLTADELLFGESPPRFPEFGGGIQYHARAAGLIGFARAILALQAEGGAS